MLSVNGSVPLQPFNRSELARPSQAVVQTLKCNLDEVVNPRTPQIRDGSRPPWLFAGTVLLRLNPLYTSSQTIANILAILR